MTKSPEKPTGITADKSSRKVSISWDDGHASLYPFGLLRAACPCASCRGGHQNMRPEPDADVFVLPMVESASTRLSTVKPVGAYAVTMVCEDGHDYGIYNWHYLRALCPCDECRARFSG